MYHAKIPKEHNINVDNFLTKKTRKMGKNGKCYENNIEEQEVA